MKTFFYNGKVYTGKLPLQEAFTVENGLFFAVGSNEALLKTLSPEDRKIDGIIGELSVRDNIILALQVLTGFFKPFSKAKAQIKDDFLSVYAVRYSHLCSV